MKQILANSYPVLGACETQWALFSSTDRYNQQGSDRNLTKQFWAGDRRVSRSDNLLSCVLMSQAPWEEMPGSLLGQRGKNKSS